LKAAAKRAGTGAAKAEARLHSLKQAVLSKGAQMTTDQRSADIETLAKMAARLAGRDPAEHVRCELSGTVAFDDLVWRYPDFLKRAAAAYRVLDRDR
jgi:hypothetical protein